MNRVPSKQRIREIEGEQYYFVTNFSKDELSLHYLCCYLTKIPGRIEKKATDVFGNIVDGALSLYIPLSSFERVDEFWECHEYVAPIYAEKKKIAM